MTAEITAKRLSVVHCDSSSSWRSRARSALREIESFLSHDNLLARFQIEVDFGSSESSERLISNFLRGRKKVFIVCILVVELIWILRGCDTFCLSYCTGQFVLRDNVKCVSKVLGQMWALLALRGVPGLLRHILGLISGAV